MEGLAKDTLDRTFPSEVSRKTQIFSTRTLEFAKRRPEGECLHTHQGLLGCVLWGCGTVLGLYFLMNVGLRGSQTHPISGPWNMARLFCHDQSDSDSRREGSRGSAMLRMPLVGLFPGRSLRTSAGALFTGGQKP